MRLRSPRELAFRVHQQAANLTDRLFPAPRFRGNLKAFPLPKAALAAAEFRDLPFQQELGAVAGAILSGELPVFGETLSTGPAIDWRRDYRNGISTPVRWFKQIPFLDFDQAGDHKYIWEVNRHQHLVALAQHWVLTGNAQAIERIEADLQSWNEQNPYVRSVNWASALELALRALSWLWVLHLAGDVLKPETHRLLGDLLLRHGRVISHNLSTYFAPNTHILGEAVALHAIGLALGHERWRRRGAAMVDRELRAQVQADGFHFEQSSYYHVYALDMFLFHYLLRGRPKDYEPALIQMARAAASLLDEARTMPLIGDDDGGRFFFPYGRRVEFANASIATCAALFPDARLPARESDLSGQAMWWLGPVRVRQEPLHELSEHWSPSGLSVFRRGEFHLTFDCGPFSRGGAGHSHADTLAVTLRVCGEDILVDPGTFTYVADPQERDWFRGTGAHSTVKVGGQDQADPVKPFRWENKPRAHRTESSTWRAVGECRYRGWQHQRTVDWVDPRVIRVRDHISGDVPVEQIWHAALPIQALGTHRFAVGPVVIEADEKLKPEIREAWRSPVFGSRERSFILSCAGASGFFDTSIHLPERRR